MSTPNDILVLPLEGDLDVTSVPRVRSLIEQRLDSGCERVIINMAKVTYIDSTGVALLLTTAKKLHYAGGLLSLINVSDPVYRTLSICRLVDFIPTKSNAPKPPIPALSASARPLWSGVMNVHPEKLSSVRKRLAEVLENTDLTPEEVFDLTLAGGEALGNAIDHTCSGGVLCSLEVYSDRAILEITDCGEGFEMDCDGNATKLDADENELERGRGIKLMRLLADSVEIQPKATGNGTVVKIVKLYTPLDIQHGAE